METHEEMLRRQITGYTLANLEWRTAMQEFIEHYTGTEGHWVAEIKHANPIISMYDKTEQHVEQLRFSPIGSYSPETQSWLWAWANPAFPYLLSRRAENIRRFGEKYGIDQLTIPELYTTPEDVEQFNILASAVYGARKPVIWLPDTQGHLLCVLIEDDLDLPPVNIETFTQVLQIAYQIPVKMVDLQQSIKDYGILRDFNVTPDVGNIITTFADQTSLEILTAETAKEAVTQ